MALKHYKIMELTRIEQMLKSGYFSANSITGFSVNGLRRG